MSDGPQGTSSSSCRVLPSASARSDLLERGGAKLVRCYQCAACTGVCALATREAPFPRRQLLWMQWGLVDRIVADPAIWLCHQCNDCTSACPRDAKPGDILQVARAVAVEHLAVPRIAGRLVGATRRSWPVLLLAPVVAVAVLVACFGDLTASSGALVHGNVVPHSLIYAVYFPALGLAGVAALASAARAWRLWNRGGARQGSAMPHILPVLVGVARHSRFGLCGTAGQRRWGHFLLLWGFVWAALASGLIVVGMYEFDMLLPLPQTHGIKIVANVSAAALVVGCIWIVVHRLRRDNRSGATTAFDAFFLAQIVLLVASGVLTEIGRYIWHPRVAVAIYIAHLGVVLGLFLTFPYSKLAHSIYRTLALVHQRMAQGRTGR